MICSVLSVCSVVNSSTVAGALVVTLRRAADRPAAVFGRIELDIRLDKTYTNPFDPDEIAVDAQITSPDGKTLRLPAFWCAIEAMNYPAASA